MAEANEEISDQIDKLKTKNAKTPDPKDVMDQANRIYEKLDSKYSGKEQTSKMTFEEKRDLLYWLFSGETHEGKPYGIYISVTTKDNFKSIDFKLLGRIVGIGHIIEDEVEYLIRERHKNYRTKNVSFKLSRY